MPNNIWIRISALFGFTGVLLGAFAAHFLKQRLSPEMFDVFQVGVKYHLIHAVSLLAISFYAEVKNLNIRWLGVFFSYGIFLFSGSLYVMAVSGIKPLGMITPIGGVLFLCGWGWLWISCKK